MARRRLLWTIGAALLLLAGGVMGAAPAVADNSADALAAATEGLGRVALALVCVGPLGPVPELCVNP